MGVSKLGRRCAAGRRLLHARGTEVIKTAAEIIDELEKYNDTYVYYLAKTFIPLALEELDAEFGGRRADLVSALRARATRITNPVVIGQLEATAQLAEGPQR